MALITTALTDLPAQDAQVIVPSDTVGQGPFRALYVGVAGDVTLVTLGGNTVLFKAVPVGVLPVGFRRVNASATAATNMVGLT
jgi:hypothetical protein